MADPFERSPQQPVRPVKQSSDAGAKIFAGVMAVAGVIIAGVILLFLSSWLIGWPEMAGDGEESVLDTQPRGESSRPDFANSMATYADEQGHAFGQLADLVDAPRLGDPEWEADVEMYADSIIMWSEQMKRLQPPNSQMARAHRYASDACDRYIEAMELLKRGIANTDAGAIERVQPLMAEGSRLMGKATAELNGE